MIPTGANGVKPSCDSWECTASGAETQHRQRERPGRLPGRLGREEADSHYPHRLRAIGHLFEAEDESQAWPDLPRAIHAPSALAACMLTRQVTNNEGPTIYLAGPVY
jgi:hypothetical protein